MKVEKKTTLRLGSFAIYATLALIVAKVAGIINIRWLMVFTPIWLWLAAFIFCMVLMLIVGLVIIVVQGDINKSDAASRKRDDTREM